MPQPPGPGKAERYVQPSLLLALKDGPSYGYELITRIAEHGFLSADAPPGMIYRHLRRMEDEGLVESRWDVGGSGPAKRIYAITPDGREVLEAWVAYMQRMAARLTAFVRRYHSGS